MKTRRLVDVEEALFHGAQMYEEQKKKREEEEEEEEEEQKVQLEVLVHH
jgi:hypothetical protein